MLDHDLATLAAAPPDITLAGLEEAIWTRAAHRARLHRMERATWSAQGLVLAVVLTASTAIGVAVARPSAPASASASAFLVAAELAPSSLLGSSR